MIFLSINVVLLILFYHTRIGASREKWNIKYFSGGGGQNKTAPALCGSIFILGAPPGRRGAPIGTSNSALCVQKQKRYALRIAFIFELC
jgi:hypothetical protein